MKNNLISVLASAMDSKRFPLNFGMVMLSVLVCLLTVLIYLWQKKVNLYSHIPTPKYNIPLFGHVFRIPSKTRKLLDFQKMIYEELKSKTRVMWVLSRPVVTTMDVSNMEEVLKSQVYINKGRSYKLLKEWIGDGLLISDGEKWKSRRRLLTPAFHFDVLKKNFEIMNHHANDFIQYMKKSSSENPIEVSCVAKYFSLNVICETAMGVRYDIEKTLGSTTEQGKYVDAVDNLLHMLVSRVLKPWFYSRFMYRYFSSDGKKFYEYLDIAKTYVQGVIEKRIKALENVDEIKSNIFLDILIAAHKKGEIDVEGIIEEVNTFMFEGHDTVSSAIAWTLYLLGRNENVQNKVLSEIQEFDENDLDLEKLSQCKYLECMIKESLRIHPPVPGFSRLLKDETVLPNNLRLPKNTTLGLHVYHMHRNDSYWENPTTFSPERFLNVDSKSPFSYVPFSAGPRNCIGQRFAMMELKVIMFRLLKNFKFLSVQAEDEVEEHGDIIHRSTNGLWVKFIPRA